jgi:hypothetical protein
VLTYLNSLIKDDEEEVDLDDIEEIEQPYFEDLTIDLSPDESYNLKKYLRKKVIYDI